MPDMIADGLWIYAEIGLAVGLAFLLVGIDRVDAASHGAYAVRPLLLPGLIMLWPLVLVRWFVLERRRARSRA